MFSGQCFLQAYIWVYIVFEMLFCCIIFAVLHREDRLSHTSSP